MQRYSVFFLIILFTLGACLPDAPVAVERELDKMSKVDQKKFEKVIRHYRKPADSLKLKATYFLLENINDFGSYHGRMIDNYNTVFDILAAKPADYRINLPWYATEINVIFDSLLKIYGPFTGQNLLYISDAEAMKEEMMIRHIDQAFEAWDNPWSRHVSFQNFCEYILPYRNFSEPIEDWRRAFIEEFSWIYDSINEDSEMMEVARKLNYDTELKYSRGFDRYIVSIPPSRLLQAKYGNCADNSNYKAMIMRAFGIPVSVDYLPQYGTDHNIHYWNAIMMNNDHFVSFWDTLNDINAMVAHKYTIGKVYRRTFSRNPEMIRLQQSAGSQVPHTFRNVRIKDVTEEYVPVSDVLLPLNNQAVTPAYAYLAVFNDAGWTPIAFAPVDSERNVHFKNLGRDVVYLPLTLLGNKYSVFAPPFKIEPDGQIIPLIAQRNTEQVILTRKYHFHRRKMNWLRCLIGGKFEGANQPDFSDAVTLANIQKTPSEHPNTLQVSSFRKFKYFRFVFSPDEQKLAYDGDGASLAEIEIFNRKGEKLTGNPLGTEGRKYNPYTAEKCFDGNGLTFFEDARPNEVLKYVGLELPETEQIGHIVFTPRNDLNTIQSGDLYELFYWDNKQFNSLRRQEAADTLIIFNNVPKGALLWLRNLSGGREERIFTWENEKQRWW